MHDISGPLNSYRLEPLPDASTNCDALETLPGVTCVPKLEEWLELEISERVVICGVIYNHINYSDGMRILTSSITDYISDEEGRAYVLTNNSKYELGTRLKGKDQEHLLKTILFAEGVSNPELIKLRLRAIASAKVLKLQPQ